MCKSRHLFRFCRRMRGQLRSRTLDAPVSSSLESYTRVDAPRHLSAMTISPPDPNAFRHVMGHFGSGVTIITSGSAESPVGFTASSVASLSLDPLLVMVGVAADGESLARIRESGGFGVNILTRDQEALAMHFARSDREDRFREVDVRRGSTGTPLLGASLAWLDCALHAEFAAGDHVVVVGRVVECDAGPGEPLLYFRGRFGGWLS